LNGNVTVQTTTEYEARLEISILVRSYSTEDLLPIARCTFSTMDSAVLGLGSSGCSCCTVRVFRLKFTLEDAIGSHAFAPLEAILHACDQWHYSRESTASYWLTL
jgi:hypothetical protein